MKEENEYWLEVLGKRCPKDRELIRRNCNECYRFFEDRVSNESKTILLDSLDVNNNMHNDMLQIMLRLDKTICLKTLKRFGNKTHHKDSIGHERWLEYDNKGNEIHYKDSWGLESWTGYDDKGNVIHYKNSDGHEWWKEYDNKGNEIHIKNGDER